MKKTLPHQDTGPPNFLACLQLFPRMIQLERILTFKKENRSTKVRLEILTFLYIGKFPKICVIQSRSGHLLFVFAKSSFPFFEMVPWTYIRKGILSLWSIPMKLLIKIPLFSSAKEWTCDPSYTNQMLSSSWNLKLMWNSEKTYKKQLVLINPIWL